MKILAIDYGDRHVGLAIGYCDRRLAFPLPQIKQTSRKALLDAIRGICTAYEVQMILLGYPRHRDGRLSRTCEKIDQFALALQKKLGLPVEKIDEHLTSWEAEETLKALDKNRRRRKELADSFAAEGIIRGYFEKK